MTIADLLNIALPLGLAFIMLALGIGLTLDDFARIARRPKAFFAGALAQLILLPLFIFGLVHLIPLSPELSLGVMIIAFCPGGVTSNVMTKLAGGEVALSISLTGLISLLSVITLPIFTAMSAAYFLKDSIAEVDAAQLGIAMFLMTALPVTIGIILRHVFPKWSAGIEPMFLKVATLIFILIVIASIVVSWPVIQENITTLIPLILLMNALLIIIGLGVAKGFKLRRPEQVTIAIETGVQNGALGITIGALIAGGRAELAVLSLPSGAYGITIYIVTLPFIFWARRQLSKPE